jgi:hypothetical protein
MRTKFLWEEITGKTWEDKIKMDLKEIVWESVD